MGKLEKIIFVGRSGTCREPMALGILQDISLKKKVEILARGLVVSFPEPMNGKAEAVLIGNGINLEKFVSQELTNEDITENTMIFTMEEKQRQKVLSKFKRINSQRVFF